MPGGVYGAMVHTLFFAALTEAQTAFDEIKPALVELIAAPPGTEDRPSDPFETFVERFPVFQSSDDRTGE